MVNTILARRVNHIVAKGDNPAWPKGSKSRGFSTILLAEYFRTTAVKVQTAVSQEQLSELHRNIYLSLPQRFTTAEGIGIAESYGMKEHAFKMFLKRHIGTLFRKENHGEYSK